LLGEEGHLDGCRAGIGVVLADGLGDPRFLHFRKHVRHSSTRVA
jgi:hypothetical protein